MSQSDTGDVGDGMLHQLEYEYWRTNKQNVTATAQHFGCTRKTIYRWMKAENWQAVAARGNAKQAEALAETSARQLTRHVTDGETAVENARRNHGNLQQCIGLLAALTQDVLKQAQGKVKTSADLVAVLSQAGLEELRLAVATDAKIAATLYPALIPQHIAVSQVPSPADDMREQFEESVREFELVAGQQEAS